MLDQWCELCPPPRLSYEPRVFYSEAEQLRAGDAGGGGGGGGAGVARGWSVRALDVSAHSAQLAAGEHTATITYGKCLIATGQCRISVGSEV